MVSEVYIIGVGMGNPRTLTGEAREALERSELIVGSSRLLEAFAELNTQRVALVSSAAIAELLHTSDARVTSVVMSGDVGFYSGATALYPLLEDMHVQVIPGISSVAYLCARLKTTWQDAHLVSAHGRASNVVGVVQSHAKTLLLTGGTTTPQALCAQLVERGLGDVRVSVGERLSYDDERITAGTARELAVQIFDGLSAMLVENDHPLCRDLVAPQLPDSAFVRGDVPMTKEEVRALAICKLRIHPASTVWDVGAGTGSVSVEAARAAFEGQVLAIERDARALELLEQNKAAFGLVNLQIVAGEAPAALAGLPAPDCVFVGGSGGQLEEILHMALCANPKARLCVTAITLETLTTLLACVKDLGLRNVDIAQLSVAKAREVGHSHLMMAHNPIYLVSADGPGITRRDGSGADGTARRGIGPRVSATGAVDSDDAGNTPEHAQRMCAEVGDSACDDAPVAQEEVPMKAAVMENQAGGCA